MMAARVRRIPTAPLRLSQSSLIRCATASYRQQQRLQSTATNHFVPRSTTISATDDGAWKGAGGFLLAVKDNIATSGLPTQCASGILQGHTSPFEATVVRQLRARGGTVVGKTNMDEFGMGSHSTHSVHGPVRNPLDTSLSAGGSSGGSAVAVAVGDADVALGTDTGGSIRLPAAYTGCVGYKPSYGMLSRHGVVPYANSLDTVGLLARSVGPIRELVVDGGLDREHDPQDPTSLSDPTRRRCAGVRQPMLGPLSGLTVGIPLDYNVEELDPLIREAWTAVAEALAARGVSVVPVSLPTTRDALAAYYVLAPAEASSNLAKYDGVRYGVRYGDSSSSPPTESSTTGDDETTLYSDTRGAGFGQEVKRRILLGTYTLSSDAMDNYFIQAQRVRRLVQRDFDRVFRLANPLYKPPQFDLSDMDDATLLRDKQGPEQVDFLLCPTAPTLPPRLQDQSECDGGGSVVDAYTNDVLTVPASLAGLPAISVPVKTGGALPTGMQLIAQYWDDARLLAMAEELEKMVTP